MVDEALQYQKTHKYELLFPDTGPFRRELYPKQLEFFSMGARYRERMFRAGNQVGKSLAGCYEDTAHLTGQYPSWWEGKRFLSPVKLWACAETAKKVREVLQAKLFGATEDDPENAKSGIIQGHSTGLIPGDCVGRPRRKSGTAGALDYVPVRHRSGGWSRLIFKSYEEGWESFESDVVDVIHFDEEPDAKIYAGGLMRTITRGGITMITVTPLHGLTSLQQSFLAA